MTSSEPMTVEQIRTAMTVAAKRLRLGIEGPKTADELDAAQDTIATLSAQVEALRSSACDIERESREAWKQAAHWRQRVVDSDALLLEAKSSVGWGGSQIAPETHDKIRAHLADREGVNPAERFCDGNCTWTDHHPECAATGNGGSDAR